MFKIEIGQKAGVLYIKIKTIRVISLRGMQKALGFSSSGSGQALKNMLDNKRVSPFIDRVVKSALNDVIEFKRPGSGGSAN